MHLSWKSTLVSFHDDSDSYDKNEDWNFDFTSVVLVIQLPDCMALAGSEFCHENNYCGSPQVYCL
jgi:hypothetical protein